MTSDQIIKKLKFLSNPKSLESMARFGITPEHAFGVSIPDLRGIAKTAKRNHSLAKKLWSYNTRETRILSSMIDKPYKVNEKQMELWVQKFDYWEICDQTCMNLFEKTPFAWEKALEWSKRKKEFVKRAGFVLMARLAVSDKKTPDKKFERFLPLILKESVDERNFVKKAVNWALRQIGKRSLQLNKKALLTAKKIEKLESKSAKWIAKDAIRELTSDAVQKRLKKKSEG